MAHKLIEAIPVSNRILTAGAIAGALTALGVAWVQFGGAVPLTEGSPVIRQSVEFDKIHDLEILRINAEIRQAQTARLEGSIESDGFLLGQFDKDELSEGDRFQKSRLNRRIEKHKRELDRLDKK